MRQIDLNADCGESFGAWRLGDDERLLAIVTSANLACGGHAGDPDTIAHALALAHGLGVSVGAHPGYADLAGFGRRVIPMSPAQIERLIAHQVGALLGQAALAGVPVAHVKAHGALSNVASRERDMAEAVARAVRAIDPGLVLLAPARSALDEAGRAAGLAVACEIFADRAYLADGNLVPRNRAGAVIRDPAVAATRTLAMLEAGAILPDEGEPIATAIHSICVHGDEPGAVAVAGAVRAALEGAGWRLAPFARDAM